MSKPFRPELSAGELVRQCGDDLGNRMLWAEFQRRFQKRIFLYLLRASYTSSSGSEHSPVRENLSDLAQEVYVRLLRNEGRMLKAFRQDSELAVRAFLARVATAVVSDYFRYQSTGKRKAQVIPIDQARETFEKLTIKGVGSESSHVDSLLSLIDVERELASSDNRGRTARDLLIFQLYCVDGFTAEEVAAFPGFRLGAAGVEAAVSRIRSRLKANQSRSG